MQKEKKFCKLCFERNRLSELTPFGSYWFLCECTHIVSPGTIVVCTSRNRKKMQTVLNEMFRRNEKERRKLQRLKKYLEKLLDIGIVKLSNEKKKYEINYDTYNQIIHIRSKTY